MNSGEQSSKPDLYVIARIIKALKEKNRMNKTALATSPGLPYDKLVKYLAWMSERGFVTLIKMALYFCPKKALRSTMR